MAFSFHTHSGQFCMHASGQLEEIVKRAIEVEFTHLGLSEHKPRTKSGDLYPEEHELLLKPTDLSDLFDSYVIESRRLQAKYEDRINILVGMETEYIRPECIAEIRQLKRKHALEYLVGSIHHVDGMPIDFSADSFAECERALGTTEVVFRRYYAQQRELITQIEPEVVGHLDKIAVFRPDFKQSSHTIEAMKKNVKIAIDYGALFEVNTAGYAKIGRPYPSEEIIKFIVSSGGKLTFSDDCHSPLDVGGHYGNLAETVRKMNLEPHIYYLEYDKQAQTLSSKPVSRCLEHKAWKQF